MKVKKDFSLLVRLEKIIFSANKYIYFVFQYYFLLVFINEYKEKNNLKFLYDSVQFFYLFTS